MGEEIDRWTEIVERNTLRRVCVLAGHRLSVAVLTAGGLTKMTAMVWPSVSHDGTRHSHKEKQMKQQ